MGKPDRPKGFSTWGIVFLVGFGLAVATCLVASALGSFSQPLLSLAVPVGGWLLIFSAVAFFRDEPECGVINALSGAFVGGATMALLVAGWTSMGQTLGSIVSGAFLGAVVGVPLGWVVRSLRGRLAWKGAIEPEPGPHELRDHWVDA
jgi:ABC-type Fe3+ transport system permease subunit